MAGETIDLDDDQTAGHVGWRTAIISILGFWLFYNGIVTLRAAVLDYPDQGEAALRRFLVALVGIAATLLLWLVLRQFDRQRLWVRVIVAAIACLPAAIAFASANYYFFNVYDAGLMPDVEQLAPAPSVWLEIVETAIWRYFFLIAWASLYLAISYAGEVRSAERRAAAFAQAAQTAELRALRYQVNPHFLFNALNSLSALVMNGRKQDAESMIMNLATFYRSTLSGDSAGDVSLEEEVALQQRYLDVEAVRFPGRLKVDIQVPDALKHYAVPGLILQPLVENAIKHGVSRTSKPVLLSISVSEREDSLQINVTNTGLASAATSGGTGIGLANVRDRLAARYGDAARFTAGPKADGGFGVELIIPKESLL